MLAQHRLFWKATAIQVKAAQWGSELQVLHCFTVSDFGGDNQRQWTVTLFVDSVYENIVVKLLSSDWTN